jgi:hypothetical protein
MIINKICVLDENVDLALLVVILVAKLRVVRADYSLVADGTVRCNSSHRTGGQQQRRQKIEQSRALAGRERMRII